MRARYSSLSLMLSKLTCFQYDLIITVNITCMMVLASVYLSVSSSLPGTPRIKPVEAWLLFNLGYPFLVIVTNTILQVFEKKINVAVSVASKGKLFKENRNIYNNTNVSFLRKTVKYLNPVIYVAFSIFYFTFYTFNDNLNSQ